MPVQKHRTPKKQWTLKDIPAFVLPEHRNQLVSNLDATKMLIDAGVIIGNTKLYKAFRERAFSGYQIGSKLYFIKSELEAAKKNWPRTVPRAQGYYPSEFVEQRLRSIKTPKQEVNPIAFTYYVNVA